MLRTEAKSIKEFCSSVGISRATFYRHIDNMPRTVQIGRQRRILEVDEKNWLEKLETAN